MSDEIPSNLGPFVDELNALQLEARTSDEAISLVKPIVERWTHNPDWLDPSYRKALTDEDDHVIYIGPDGHLMILIVTWKANQTSVIHDHNTWAVIGVIQGVEKNQLWQRVDDCSNPNTAELIPGRTVTLHPHDVIAMEPDAIHCVSSCDPSGIDAVSFHIYGRDLRNTGRHKYDHKTHKVEPMLNLDT